ncbi:hypothetical protein [Marinomonas arenicola]|uniref:Uncharacterized protein n=1 Tax=Marinomonas arenicola TaxID=569601 RepID=A0ABU9G703_9GAMM
MKYVSYHWKSRFTIILLVSLAVAGLLATLDLTSWAEQINQQGYTHGGDGEGKPNIPTVLMYVLPFVKELVLIGVPMLLALLVMTLSAAVKRKRHKRKN